MIRARSNRHILLLTEIAVRPYIFKLFNCCCTDIISKKINDSQSIINE